MPRSKEFIFPWCFLVLQGMPRSPSPRFLLLNRTRVSPPRDCSIMINDSFESLRKEFLWMRLLDTSHLKDRCHNSIHDLCTIFSLIMKIYGIYVSLYLVFSSRILCVHSSHSQTNPVQCYQNIVLFAIFYYVRLPQR